MTVIHRTRLHPYDVEMIEKHENTVTGGILISVTTKGKQKEAVGLHHFLQLDFSDNCVSCMNRAYPIGTIAVFAMNVSAKELEELRTRCSALQSFRYAFNRGKILDAHILSARSAAIRIIEFLGNSNPFRPLAERSVREHIGNLFSRHYVAMALSLGTKNINADQLNREQQEALAMLRMTDVLSNLADAIEALQKYISPFAESLRDDNCQRTREGYASAFSEYFHKTVDYDPNDSFWTSMVNTTVQYKATHLDGMMGPVIVTSMEFVSFGGMFRAEFFEGLRVGHAPKKCAICGRWFLTTNARHTKYCNDRNPEDPRGLTCRQIGAQMGIAHKEKALDHPLKMIHARTTNTIDKRYSRGKLTSDQQYAMKRLASDKLMRAISDVDYANRHYSDEMNVDALLAEVHETA